jgi:hypothetical protein
MAMRDVTGEVSVHGGPFGSRVRLAIPDGVPGRIYHPMLAMPTFSHFFEGDPFRPQFGVALVSCQFDRPASDGETRFRIIVDAKE